jgi:DNA repair exonuclease SbcCD ATPase subunit
MPSPVTIAAIEIENVKRAKAVALTPAPHGLTTIGGLNRQGKSSVLDAIAAALGGEKFTPTNPIHDGADKARAMITLSNGVTAKRIITPNGSYLTVTDTTGRKGGQSLLNAMISSIALDLSEFLNATPKRKADILLQTIGVDLTPLEERRAALFAKRTTVGQLHQRQKKHAEAMPYEDALPAAPLTPTELVAQLETILTHNAHARDLVAHKDHTRSALETAGAELRAAQAELARVQRNVEEAAKALTIAQHNHNTATAALENDAADLLDDSAIRKQLADTDELNAKIRRNLDRAKALAEAEAYGEEYDQLTAQISAIDTQKHDLLAAAAMPLPGLSVDGGQLTFNSKAWDCMSHAEQLITAAAIAHATNPNTGFVLIDKIEAMDLPTLADFASWLTTKGLQAIATRVSTGPECSIIIEDGLIAEQHRSLDNPTFD